MVVPFSKSITPEMTLYRLARRELSSETTSSSGLGIYKDMGDIVYKKRADIELFSKANRCNINSYHTSFIATHKDL